MSAGAVVLGPVIPEDRLEGCQRGKRGGRLLFMNRESRMVRSAFGVERSVLSVRSLEFGVPP
jgi:hypothetical protein